MVDVEQDALRAFEQDALAFAPGVIEQCPDRVGIGQDAGCDLGKLGQHIGGAYLLLTEAAAQRIVMGQQPVDLHADRREVMQVVDPDRPAPDLVFIGRPDTAAGRADLASPGGRLAHLVQFAVHRKNQGGISGDPQVLPADRHALLGQLVDLSGKGPGIDDHAVADDRELAGAHDAGGQQRQLVGDTVDHQRVAGIVPALETHHHIGTLRQPVHQLALAFVAPLGADHSNIRHFRFL